MQKRETTWGESKCKKKRQPGVSRKQSWVGAEADQAGNSRQGKGRPGQNLKFH